MDSPCSPVPVQICNHASLKGQLHEIFNLRFFHQSTPARAPDSRPKAVSQMAL
jgi:hypothetical protein